MFASTLVARKWWESDIPSKYRRNVLQLDTNLVRAALEFCDIKKPSQAKSDPLVYQFIAFFRHNELQRYTVGQAAVIFLMHKQRNGKKRKTNPNELQNSTMHEHAALFELGRL